jgi:glutaredoxin-related protein
MLTKENYESFLKMTNIFQKAVKNAQKKHRELGIPNVFTKNGQIVWELPDGTVTTERPKGF